MDTQVSWESKSFSYKIWEKGVFGPEKEGYLLSGLQIHPCEGGSTPISIADTRLKEPQEANAEQETEPEALKCPNCWSSQYTSTGLFSPAFVSRSLKKISI